MPDKFLMRCWLFIFISLMAVVKGYAVTGLPALTRVVVINDQGFERKNEIITLNKAVFGKFDTKLFPLLKYHGLVLVHQFDDTDKNGLWNRLLVQVSVKPNSTDTLIISWVKKAQLPHYNLSTNVRLSKRSLNGKPTAEINHETRLRGFTQNVELPTYQLEGVGIESDKVAFRAFFDKRNGKDIYGKTVKTMVLNYVGLEGSWHQLQNWGMDIFKSGDSFGAGGMAIKQNGKLYRLADADTSIYNFQTEGPLAASFKLNFKNWDVGKGKDNGQEIVSMQKGDFFYHNIISFPYHAGQDFVIGMGNAGVDTFLIKKHNGSFTSIATYGKQVPGDTEPLGVAMMFPTADYISSANTQPADSIPNSSYVVLKNHPGKKQIWFFACWARTDKQFLTKEGFDAYLQRTADRLANPLKLKFIR